MNADVVPTVMASAGNPAAAGPVRPRMTWATGLDLLAATSRALFPWTMIAACLAGQGCRPDSSRARRRPPNILLIMADDLGYNDLGVRNPELSTPVLDAFFEGNISFLRHYADSTCQPTRVGLLTGRHPASLSVAPRSLGIPADVPTLPARLRGRGYRTEHIGKWHIGHMHPDFWPLSAGYDSFFGFLDQGFLASPARAGRWAYAPPSYRDPWLMEGGGPAERHTGHLEDILTQRAVERIRDLPRDRPWFMTLWYYAPHRPIDPEERFVDEHTPAGRYKALVRQLDTNIGRVLDELASTGQQDDTVVVILSDNGGTNQELDDNFPFQGGKRSFSEGGVRTPCAMRLPGVTAAATVDAPVSYLDLMPTLLAMAGDEVAELPGRNLLPLVTGGAEPDARPLFWEARDWDGYQYGAMSADGRWRFSMGRQGDAVLHDFSTDPTGRVDLSDRSDFDPVRRDLESRYTAWHDRQRCLFEGTIGREQVVLEERGPQRTPGYYGVTWAFAVIPPDRDAPPVVLASQEGVGDVRISRGHVEANLFGKSLRAELGPAAECRTVAISTQARHPGLLAPHAEGFQAVLYVNDFPRAEMTLERFEVFDQHRTELRIHPATGANRAYRIWTEFLQPEDSTTLPGIERATRGLETLNTAGGLAPALQSADRRTRVRGNRAAAVASAGNRAACLSP